MNTETIDILEGGFPTGEMNVIAAFIEKEEPLRKLASVRKIEEIIPIEGADLIEAVRIGGWIVVVKKEDKFQVGNLCVYCEIDSILPEKPEFEFLRERKFRIKIVKMRGMISSGICFPLSILNNYGELNLNSNPPTLCISSTKLQI